MSDPYMPEPRYRDDNQPRRVRQERADEEKPSRRRDIDRVFFWLADEFEAAVKKFPNGRATVVMEFKNGKIIHISLTRPGDEPAEPPKTKQDGSGGVGIDKDSFMRP